ncbi:MAG: hypothetical protein ACOCP5_03725, partial [Halanaerobiaceae bacterium]
LTEELGKTSEDIESLEEQVNKLDIEERDEAFEKEIKEVNDTISNLSSETEDLKSRVNTMEDDYEEVVLEEDLGNLNEQISDLEEEIDNINSILEEKSEFNQEDLNELEDKYAVNISRLKSDMEDSIEKLRSENSQSQSQINELKQENEEYRTYLMGIGAVALLSLIM